MKNLPALYGSTAASKLARVCFQPLPDGPHRPLSFTSARMRQNQLFPFLPCLSIGVALLATSSLLANQNDNLDDLESPLHYVHPDGHRLEVELGFDNVDTYLVLTVNAEAHLYYTAEVPIGYIPAPNSIQWTFYDQTDTKQPAGKGSMKLDLDKVVLSFTEAPRDVITGKGLQGTYRRLRLAERLEFAEKDYASTVEQMDQRLAELRQKLKDLPQQLQDLEQGQTRWLQYRKHMMTLPALPGFPPVDNSQLNDSSKEIYLQGMAKLTEDRAKFLSIYTGESVAETQGGSYTDGLGGRLLIRKIDEKGFDFSLTVDRGMMKQDGKISGRAIIDPAQADRALFVDTDAEAFVDGKPCQIRFSFLDKRINLIAVHSGHYHDPEVKFDGEYFKESELADE